MKKIALLCLIAGIATCAHAQQPAPGASSSPPVLPAGPLLKPVPDNTRWTLVTTAKVPETAKPDAEAGKSPESAKPQEKAKGPATTMVGEKMGKMAHVVIARANGAREEQWTDGALLATMSPGAKALSFSTGSIQAAPMPAWVSPANFAEIKTQGEKSYLIFRAKILPTGSEVVRAAPAPDQGGTQESTRSDIDPKQLAEARAFAEAQAKESEEMVKKMEVDATAVIDADTRLPVAVQEGNATTAYKFEPLPPNAQIIPPAIQTEITARAQKIKSATRQSVRP